MTTLDMVSCPDLCITMLSIESDEIPFDGNKIMVTESNDRLLSSNSDRKTAISSDNCRNLHSATITLLTTITPSSHHHQQPIYLIIGLSAMALFFASLIILATLSFNLCPLEPKLPVWLIGFGITGLLSAFTLAVSSLISRSLIVKANSPTRNHCIFIYSISIVYAILFVSFCYHLIVGNCILYSVGSDWNDRHSMSNNYYCDPPTYWCMSSIVLIIDVLLPIFICALCWRCFSSICDRCE